MPRLKSKTKLVRAIARQVAEKLAAEGDTTIMDTAEEFARDVKWISVDGALEIIFCTAMHHMKSNGHAQQVAELQAALERYDEGERDD
jgi:hypothetical protein